jgi:hypothetical protein
MKWRNVQSTMMASYVLEVMQVVPLVDYVES